MKFTSKEDLDVRSIQDTQTVHTANCSVKARVNAAAKQAKPGKYVQLMVCMPPALFLSWVIVQRNQIALSA